MPFTSDNFFNEIVSKLQHTFQKYGYIPEVEACGVSITAFATVPTSKDEQIDYLLSVAMSMLQNVPSSPFLEELFNNFLKDYIHFVNPGHVYHLAEYYLNDDFILKQQNQWAQTQPSKIRYI